MICHIYIYICICICISIYIYIYVERERELDRQIDYPSADPRGPLRHAEDSVVRHAALGREDLHDRNRHISTNIYSQHLIKHRYAVL